MNPPKAPIPPANPPTGAAATALATLGIHLKTPQFPVPKPIARTNNPIT